MDGARGAAVPEKGLEGTLAPPKAVGMAAPRFIKCVSACIDAHAQRTGGMKHGEKQAVTVTGGERRLSADLHLRALAPRH